MLANMGRLRIVLVSSEGSIMLMLEKLSAMNRPLVYGIDDSEHERVLAFLMKSDVPEHVSRKLVDLVGARIVSLVKEEK